MAIQRWVGIGLEATFGTAVAAKYFLDPTSVGLGSPSDPFIRYGGASGRGNRALVPAPYVPEGDIEAAVDLWRAGILFRALIPEESYYQELVTKSGTATTLSAAATAGDTVLSVTSEAGFAVGDYIEVNDPGFGEVHKVTNVAVGQLTIEDGLTRDHPIGANVEQGSAGSAYRHLFEPGGLGETLDSMTVRVAKDFDEQIFTGCVLSQLRLRGAYNSLLEMTASLVGKSDATGPVTALPSGDVLATTPYAGPYLITANLVDPDNPGPGDKDVSAYIRSFEATLNNNVAGEDGVRMGSRFPVEHRAQGLDVTGKLTLVFRTRDQYGDFWGGVSPQETVGKRRTVTLAYQYDTDHEVRVELFNAYITGISSPVSGRDVLVQEIEYESMQPNVDPFIGGAMARLTLQNTEEYRYF